MKTADTKQLIQSILTCFESELPERKMMDIQQTAIEQDMDIMQLQRLINTVSDYKLNVCGGYNNDKRRNIN